MKIKGKFALFIIAAVAVGFISGLINQVNTSASQGQALNGRRFNTLNTAGVSTILSSRMDGSDEKTIFSTDTDSVSSVRVSRDGLKLIFSRQYNKNASTADIFTMDFDGENVTKITDDPTHSNDSIDISPDGQTIVFGSARDHASRELYTMGIDGSNVTRITNNTYYDGNPIITFDNRIILQSSEGVADRNTLYSVNIDGSNRQRMFNTEFDVNVSTNYDRDALYFSTGKLVNGVMEYELTTSDTFGQNKANITSGSYTSPTMARALPEDNGVYFSAQSWWHYYDTATGQITNNIDNRGYTFQPLTIRPSLKTNLTTFTDSYDVRANIKDTYKALDLSSTEIIFGDASVDLVAGIITINSGNEVKYKVCSKENAQLCSEFIITRLQPTIEEDPSEIEAPNTGYKY